MISWILFSTLAILYYCVRLAIRIATGNLTSPWKLEKRSIHVIQELILQRGGSFARTRRRIVTYYTPSEEIRFSFGSRPRLEILIRKEFKFGLSAYRVPRLLYAFLESFLSPSVHFEGQPFYVATSTVDAGNFLRSRPGFMNILPALSKSGFSFRFGQYGLKLVKTLRAQDLETSRILAHLEMAGMLASIAAHTIPVQQISSDQKCAYCKESIQMMDTISFCQFCHTPHHAECYQLNRGCSVFGCAPVAPQPEAIPIVQ